MWSVNTFDSELSAVAKFLNNVRVMKDRTESIQNTDGVNYEEWPKYQYYKVVKKNKNCMIVSAFNSKENLDSGKKGKLIRIINKYNDFDELLEFIEKSAMEVI